MRGRQTGLSQEGAAAKAGILVRSGKEQRQLPKSRSWRTRIDPLASVWHTELVPLLEIVGSRLPEQPDREKRCSAISACCLRLPYLGSRPVPLGITIDASSRQTGAEATGGSTGEQPNTVSTVDSSAGCTLPQLDRRRALDWRGQRSHRLHAAQNRSNTASNIAQSIKPIRYLNSICYDNLPSPLLAPLSIYRKAEPLGDSAFFMPAHTHSMNAVFCGRSGLGALKRLDNTAMDTNPTSH